MPCETYFFCKFLPSDHRLSNCYVTVDIRNTRDVKVLVCYKDKKVNFFNMLKRMIKVNKIEAIVKVDWIGSDNNFDFFFCESDEYSSNIENNTMMYEDKIESLPFSTILSFAVITNKIRNLKMVLRFLSNKLTKEQFKYLIFQVFNKNSFLYPNNPRTSLYSKNVCIDYLISIYKENNIPEYLNYSVYSYFKYFSMIEILEKLYSNRFLFFEEVEYKKFISTKYVIKELEDGIRKCYCFDGCYENDDRECKKNHHIGTIQDVYNLYYCFYNYEDEDTVTKSFELYKKISEMKTTMNELELLDLPKSYKIFILFQFINHQTRFDVKCIIDYENEKTMV